MSTGCQCQPAPAPPTVPEDPTPPVDPTADTAPPPPCDVPECEPNNALADAGPLPLEANACGAFQADLDGDRWYFTLDRPEWISLDLDARENGSLANPQLFVSGPGVVFDRLDGDETADAHLHVPLAAGTYDVLVRDQDGSGGDDGRWFYDLQVSVQKEPAEWTHTEHEPNQRVADANPLALGDAVFGRMEGDDDLYRIDLPAGRSTLELEVVAFAAGSPADTELLLEDEAGQPRCPDGCRFERGRIGFEADPFASVRSEGDESIYVRVRLEGVALPSSAHWYVLSANLQ